MATDSAQAQTINVGSSSDLYNAILTINSNPTTNYTLNVVSGFTISQTLPAIDTQGDILIDGNSNSINGNNQYQPLVINSGDVAIENLNITNAGSPITVNSGTLIDTTGNLAGPVVNNGTVVFLESSNFTYMGSMSGTGNVVIDSGHTVTLSGPNSYTGTTTIDSGSTLVNSTYNLNGPVTTNYILDFNQTMAGTYAGVISGTGGVEISGTSAVTLTGLNNYTGGTMIDSGSTLIGTTSSLQGQIYNGGTLQFLQSTSGTYAGQIIGGGAVEISGGGTVTLTGQNEYLNGTVVDSGTKLIGTTDSLIGTITDNGSVEFSAGTLGGYNVNTSALDPAGTFSGTLTGTGSVEISGISPVTFTGTNSYSGGTLIDAHATLIGTTNGVQGTITNNGTVKFEQSTTSSYAGNMSGAGGVEIGGGGVVNFTGTNSYSGGTIVDLGSTLGGSLTGIQGNIQDNGSVIFNQGPHGTYAGNLSGTGSVELSNSVSVTFSGTNNYSGGTIIDANSVLTGTTSSLQGSIVDNGSLIFQQSTNGTFAGNVSGSGSVTLGGGATYTFSGTNSYLGGTTINSGTSLIATTTSLQGVITDNGTLNFKQSTSGSYVGNISGTGSVQVTGQGPVTFGGSNSYSGGTTVNYLSELLGTTSSLQGTIVNNGEIVFDQTSNGTFAGNISGTGRVFVDGPGAVTMSGTNSFTGGTYIGNGSTLIGTTNSLQDGITDNGVLQFNQTTAGTFNGTIDGTGLVEIGGYGPVTFTNANTYTGGTAIGNGSTLNLTSNASIGSVDVNNGGTLTGNGTVGALTVDAGGTVDPGVMPASPGNIIPVSAMIGGLTVNGNFAQSTGSTFTAGLNPSSNSGIEVNGAATIGTGTTLNLVIGSGTYTVGSKYEILHATDGITGKYATQSTSPYSQHIVFNQVYTSAAAALVYQPGNTLTNFEPSNTVQSSLIWSGNNPVDTLLGNQAPTTLEMVVTSNLSGAAQTSNQAVVASVLDQVSLNATGNLATAITQLTTLSNSQLTHALNQVSGDIIPSLSSIQRQTTTVQLQLLSNRLASLSGPGIPAVTAQKRSPGNVRFVSSQSSDASTATSETSSSNSMNWSTWAQGYGLGGSIAGDGNAGGVNYQLGGTMFGVERWLGEGVLFGVMGGYAANSVKNGDDGSSAQINTYQAGLYELFRGETIYFSNIDAFNNDNYSESRALNFGTFQQTASGNSSGNEWAHYSELGATLDFDDIRVQPFTGVQYMYLDQHGYTESGGGSLDMTTSNQIVNSVRNGAGVRLYRETTWRDILIVPSLTARYQHEWGNGTQLISTSYSGIPTATFSVAGTRTGRDFGLFSFGTTAYITEQFSLYGTVDSQVAAGYFAVIGTGGFRFSW